MKTVLWLLPLLAACASAPSKPGAQDNVQQAVMTPFNDLNLVRAEIPAPLRAAREAPYSLPADCIALTQELQALDAVLGADLDSAVKDKPSLLERGSDAVEDAAGKALRDAASGAIPFRGWVRKLSGAERYERSVAAAITAGAVRRGFLKGVAVGRACVAAAR